MSVFQYVATNPLGATVRGQLEAASVAEARQQLKRQHLTPVRVTRPFSALTVSFGRAVKLRDLVMFTRMFSVMIKSAVPMDRALKTLHEQIQSPALRQAIQRMIIDVESGHTLADSLRAQPGVFEPVYVNMIGAGEASGNLDTLLERLADMQERNEAIRAKVRSALYYPAFLLAGGFAAVGVLLWWVIPRFRSIFESAGAQLPLPTRITIALSEGLQAYWWALFAGLLGGHVLVKALRRRPAWQRRFARALLAIPVLGALVRKGATARFTRTFGTLIQSGIPMIEAIELSAGTVGNAVLEAQIRSAKGAIATGAEIAPSLRAAETFEPIVTAMIAIGEQSGRIDEMLGRVADHYDREVNTAVEAAMKLIEPAMLIVLGGMVTGILAAIYLPLFSMVSALSGGP